MIKILVISNSFGQDSVRYLNGISRAAKQEIRVANLYIGGCSLYRHYRNMLSGEAAYRYELNGTDTGLDISLQKALLLDEWDYIVTQQCSPHSGCYESYQPYLTELAAYIHRLCPPAKLCMQMTWTFAHDCGRFRLTPFRSPEEMLPAVADAYRKAADAIHAHFLLPTGYAVRKLYDAIGPSAYRDGFHANTGITRYMIGCLWFTAFTGKNVTGNSFRDFDTDLSDEQIELAQRIATETLSEAGFPI